MNRGAAAAFTGTGGTNDRGAARPNASTSIGSTRGLTSASVGLIFAATVQIGCGTLTSVAAWIVFALTLVIVYLLKWNMFVSLAVASGVGVLLNYWR